ncbi:MAG TPA: hypothetical protein VIX86_14500, partial [Streptosporangiaceae bacterium]
MNTVAKRSLFAVSAAAAMTAGVVMVLPGHGLSLIGAGRHAAVTTVAGQTLPGNPDVWRQAFAGDYVCVTPDVQAQAAADNAAATSRIAAGGGA